MPISLMASMQLVQSNSEFNAILNPLVRMYDRPHSNLLVKATGIALSLMVPLFGASYAQAKLADQTQFNQAYPDSSLTGDCKVCHTQSDEFNSYQLNSYGLRYDEANNDLSKIELEDSDNDNWDNLAEIKAGSYPGNSANIPEPILPIVNGQEAIKGEFPFMAALLKNNSPHCGGSVVSANYVLTAKHCVGTSASSLKVVLGAHDMRNLSGTQTVSVSQIITHASADVALLKVTPAIDSKYTPIKLGLLSDSEAGTAATVIGWGALGENAGYPNILRKVDAPMASRANCQSVYGKITEYEVCAGYKQGPKDSCYGDSGGPLFVRRNGAFYETGVVSWGRECGASYGVYVNVPTVSTWIQKYIGSGGGTTGGGTTGGGTTGGNPTIKYNRIQSKTGQCVAVVGTVKDLSPVEVTKCQLFNSDEKQLWQFTANGQLQPKLAPNFCLTPGSGFANGQSVYLQQCSSSAWHAWQHQNGELLNKSNTSKALQASTTKAQMMAKNGQANQQWTFVGAFEQCMLAFLGLLAFRRKP